MKLLVNYISDFFAYIFINFKDLFFIQSVVAAQLRYANVSEIIFLLSLRVTINGRNRVVRMIR